MPPANPAQTPRDNGHIDMRRGEDVDYWTQKLGVSREELAKAIESAGDRPGDVADYIAENGPPATSE